MRVDFKLSYFRFLHVFGGNVPVFMIQIHTLNTLLDRAKYRLMIHI